jgi:5'-nucleotidase (lipoprotein e(P4) family)
VPDRRPLALAAALVLAGCVSAPPASPPVAPPAPAVAAVPADDNLNAVLWSQRAVEHDLIFAEVYRDAREKLAAALADPDWDALPREEREKPVRGLAPAIILDIDETLLDNSPYQARLVRSGKEYNEFTWALWCKEAAAKPFPGAVEFTRLAASQGVAIYYISNRAKDLDAPTLANLRQAGFPVASDDVFLGLGAILPGCEQVGADKGCRRRLVGRDHRVLMQFGDQIGDFLDPVANTPEGRTQAVKPYTGWFGERWWMLPNPTYGSWEPAQFNNDWSLPRETRRRRKIDALRVD